MNEHERWIVLDGAVNVRDLGGLPTEDGGVTIPGRLLRADNLQSLTANDVSRLVDDLKLRDVVDLRSSAEVRMEGPGPLTRVPGVTFHHHTLFAEGGRFTDVAADDGVDDAPPDGAGGRAGDSGSDGAGDRARDGESDGAGDRGRDGGSDGAGAGKIDDRALPWAKREGLDDELRVTGYYYGYLRDRPDSILAALRALSRDDGAALFHCAAGKDRTGVVAALALSVAGVTREAIIADYVATAEKIEQILARLRASDTYRVDLDSKPPSSHVPRAEYISQFLHTLDTRFGGPLGWLDAQNWTSDDHRALRARLRD